MVLNLPIVPWETILFLEKMEVKYQSKDATGVPVTINGVAPILLGCDTCCLWIRISNFRIANFVFTTGIVHYWLMYALFAHHLTHGMHLVFF